MTNKIKRDVVVIGGGPAGMASAIEAEKTGASTLLIERDAKLGGILNQCIHSGFGLHYFGEELTGPEYARRFVDALKATKVEVMLNSYVLAVDNKKIVVSSPLGLTEVYYKSLVLAMGCRERTAGAICLTGTRPNGVWTAGQVQKMVNIYGKLPCKKPVILGSGDIGLIMARRLTLEGAKPQMILEVMPQTSGLARNILQCVKDYDIPLHLKTTVVEVVGSPNVTGVIVAEVDDAGKPIESTKKLVECDGLVLSVGLIPETDIISGIKINPKTKGAIVNEYRETSTPNVFACGNVLHVHDLVDFVTKESLLAGKCAGLNAKNKLNKSAAAFAIVAGAGVRYTVPNSYFATEGEMEIMFRVTQKYVKCFIEVWCGNQKVAQKFVMSANAGEMQTITVDKSKLNGDITIKMGVN